MLAQCLFDIPFLFIVPDLRWLFNKLVPGSFFSRADAGDLKLRFELWILLDEDDNSIPVTAICIFIE